MLENQDILQAAAKLVERTNVGQQSWTLFPASEDEYVTETRQFLFYVSTRDDDGEPPYKFEVWRRLKETPSEARPGSIKVGELTTEPANNPARHLQNQILNRVYVAAKTSAMGIGRLKDDLFEELGLDS